MTIDFPFGYELLMIAGGLLAGIVNTISGSGTLFTLGVMSLTGIPLNVANIATRPGVFTQNVTGIAVLRKYGQFDRTHLAKGPIIATCLGAIAGAVGAAIISSRSFDLIATIVMAVLLVQYLLPQSRSFSIPDALLNNQKLKWLLFFIAGVYGGFIQIGIGIVLLTLILGYMKLSYGQANALKLFIVLIYTIPTTLYFIINDLVLWKPALLLAVGQVLGAYVAAMFLSLGKNTAVWAKRITIVMIVATLGKIWFFG